MPNLEAALPSFDELQSLQFVWFLSGGDTAQGTEEVFKTVFGFEPDNIQRQRPPSVPFPLTLASAVDSNVHVRLQMSPARVDMVIDPIPVGDEQFPHFKDFSIIDKYLAAAMTYCRVGEMRATRQSFIIRTAARMKTREEFGPEFAKILQSEAALEDTSEHLIQINKRTKVDELEINRVLRWSTEERHVQQFAMAPGEFSFGSIVGVANFMVYIMDINTVPAVPLDGEGQILVLEKLAVVVKNCLNFSAIGDLK